MSAPTRVLPGSILDGLKRRIADAGVLLAPGGAFGHDHGDWARRCFTSVERPALDEAVGRILAVLGS